MSFSSQIKEELYERIPEARHCRIAELLALKKLASAQDTRAGALIAQLDDMLDHVYPEFDEAVLFQDCCKRAFIRGAFLASGTVSDPRSGYDMELLTSREDDAKLLGRILIALDLKPRLIARRKQYVVYIKDGDGVVEFLGLIEAHRALLEMENIRVLKEVRGNVNRRVNCETANLTKQVDASLRQREAIERLIERGQIADLSPSLQEIAYKRLEYPDATLEELGQMLEPPVGKSGVNHRLRRIMQYVGGES